VVPGRGDGVDPTVVDVIREAPVWTRRSGRHRRGLGGVEECVEKIGSMLA
jgi:hypothetical protein